MVGMTTGISEVLSVVVVFLVFVATIGLIADGVAGEKGGNLTSGQESLLDISVLMYVILGIAIVLGGINVIMGRGR